jgi:hypothetical protein
MRISAKAYVSSTSSAAKESKKFFSPFLIDLEEENRTEENSGESENLECLIPNHFFHSVNSYLYSHSSAFVCESLFNEYCLKIQLPPPKYFI